MTMTRCDHITSDDDLMVYPQGPLKGEKTNQKQPGPGGTSAVAELSGIDVELGSEGEV